MTAYRRKYSGVILILGLIYDVIIRPTAVVPLTVLQMDPSVEIINPLHKRRIRSSEKRRRLVRVTLQNTDQNPRLHYSKIHVPNPHQ